MPVERKTLWITDQNADVTTFNNGGNSGTFEEVFDLQTPTGVRYILRDGHRMRLDLDDSGDADLGDQSTIKVIATDSTEEDEIQIGDVRTLRQFNNADQYDSDEVFMFDLENEYEFTEDAHLKLKLDSSTAVSWSDSYIELEIRRVS